MAEREWNYCNTTTRDGVSMASTNMLVGRHTIFWTVHPGNGKEVGAAPNKQTPIEVEEASVMSAAGRIYGRTSLVCMNEYENEL